MTQGSSRFRTGHVSAPATPAERVRRHLDDGQRLFEVAGEQLEQLVGTGELQADQVLEVMAVVREHTDQHRVYLVHKLAAQLLVAASTRQRSDRELAWAPYFDLAIAVLMPYLEQHPHEPEALMLLGLAYYELGETPLARRLFEAIREIDPEHQQARANLRAAKERGKRGAGVAKVPDRLAPNARAHHAAAKRVAERAVKLPTATVSLCMIVKDEEEMLPGCLAAVRDHVDQMIVVDTGSSDRTREIAAEYGATVVDYPWTGSFSDARNRSVEEATGDWILYLDADEHLVEGDGEHLRAFARRPWLEGAYLVETHFTGEADMGSQSTHMAMRLYRNRPQYRFEGIIHEQKLQHFPTYLPERFTNTPVRVNHYGYLKSVVEDRSKRDRNLQLLLQQAAEGADAFTEFNIGSEYGAMHDWGKARPHFERALQLSQADPGWQSSQFAPLMVSRLVTARRATSDEEASVRLIDEALQWWPEFTDLVFERALIRNEQGNIAAARADIERALEMGDAPAKYVAAQGKGSHQARIMLAQIMRHEGDLSGARTQLEQAMEDAPQFLPTVLELADTMLLTDSPDEVSAAIDERLGERTSSPSANLLLATSFYERGHLEHAERYYDRVLAANPAHSAALIGMAELRLAQGRFHDSLDLATSVDDSDVLATRAARTAFLAGVVSHELERLDAPLRAITSADYLSVGERAFYSAWNARLTGGAAVLPPDADAAAQALANLEALAKLEATDEFEQLVPLLDNAIPDERERHLSLGALYLRRQFADMAAEEFMAAAQGFGPDPRSLTGLGKVATMKEMWEDAEVFLTESLKLDPQQQDARKLLELIRDRG